MPPRGIFGTADTPRVAALADLPTSAAEGTRVNVTQRRSVYEMSGGSWLRTLDCDPAWARSADVHVNYTSGGSDDADGTEEAPLATVSEVIARLGENQVASSGIFWIHVTGNATETKWDLRALTTATQPIVITGEPTVLLSTTISAAVAWSAATNTRGTITCASSIASYAASSVTTNGKIFRVVGGARDGTYGTLRLHTGGGAVQYDLVSYWWTPGGSQLQVGDTIEVLDCPSIPASLLVRRGTVVFFACLSGLSAGLHAGAIEYGAEGWLSACSFTGDLDCASGWLSLVGCTMAGHAARVEGNGGYLEVDSGRVYGVAIRTGGQGHLSSCTVEERIVVNEGATLMHEDAHVWLAHPATGSTIELHPSAKWIASATCVAHSGVVCGTGLAGGTAGVIRLHEDAVYRGPVPVCSASGTQINVNGTAKNFSDAASYFAASGAAIGPRSAT